MRRSRRRFSSIGASGTTPFRRPAQLFFMMVILALIYTHARDPQTWRWMAPQADDDAAPQPAANREAAAQLVPAVPDKSGAKQAAAPAARPWETVIPGPTDANADELAEARVQFGALTDQSPLTAVDMPAYWRLMRWSRAQTFPEAEKRARRNVRIASFVEEPNRQRGQLLRLKLHVRRVLDYEAPENSAGVKTVYEYWGFTDDSKSYPYVLVSSDLPPGMKLGSEVHADAVFVGYFLKTMTYEAFDKKRFAPLMVGRMSTGTATIRKPAPMAVGNWLWISLAATAVCSFVIHWIWRPGKKKPGILPIVKQAETQTDPAFAAWLNEPPPPDPVSIFEGTEEQPK